MLCYSQGGAKLTDFERELGYVW